MSDAPEQTRWTAVDEYIVDRLVPVDADLQSALAASDAAGLPPINVAPNQGKLLALIAQIAGARTVLEIGTLGGYSTIWLARAVSPGGRVLTLEFSALHASVATANLAHAGLEGVVEVRVGPALETLPELVAEGAGPFDMVFIDADKDNYAQYFAWALRLTRPGSVIVVDNVVRAGRIADATSEDGTVRGTRALFDALAAEARVSATAIQTVGSKGHDGFVLARVLPAPT